MASTLSTERVQFEAALKALLENLAPGSGGYSGTIPATRLAVINYTKAKLDELIPESEGVSYNLSSNPNVSDPLNLLIGAHLEESVKDVSLTAPDPFLKPVKLEDATGIHEDNDPTGYIILPDNYLRLISLKMADWKRSVTKVITPESPIYKRQSYKYLRGGVQKPIVVLTWKNTTGTTQKKVLEYYSVNTSHSVESLLYIPEMVAEDFVAANPVLLDALAWMCAGKIMQITGMFEAYKLAMEQVKQAYGL